jgi:hypothetical protein
MVVVRVQPFLTSYHHHLPLRGRWGIEMDKGDVPIQKEKPSEYGTYKEHPY